LLINEFPNIPPTCDPRLSQQALSIIRSSRESEIKDISWSFFVLFRWRYRFCFRQRRGGGGDSWWEGCC
jgi:hypothetical protein